MKAFGVGEPKPKKTWEEMNYASRFMEMRKVCGPKLQLCDKQTKLKATTLLEMGTSWKWSKHPLDQATLDKIHKPGDWRKLCRLDYLLPCDSMCVLNFHLCMDQAKRTKSEMKAFVRNERAKSKELVANWKLTQ